MERLITQNNPYILVCINVSAHRSKHTRNGRLQLVFCFLYLDMCCVRVCAYTSVAGVFGCCLLFRRLQLCHVVLG